jgi:hypothetical protein
VTTEDDNSYGDRIRDLYEQYWRDRAAFEPPADPPDSATAMSYLREGVGPAIMVYVDARANDWGVEFTETEFEQLHDALNGYLELYARCYGTEIDSDWTVRSAAELLIDTHNVKDVAAMLTHVPEKRQL